ncbi:28S ribosomal protein S31, mitochondrial-like [Carassius auratus]|uniref:Small ribosomal subunit protein mS31 n=1 Tax=Carassius auratus TaxID=7957 RepID=A0A6P6NV42_CARAU|nr:28S ribosomal protein S31, mitochondrial-like [Carassius auratus]XP_052449628.1 28S ribosomal protein S31, mitochondrial [Carassius gibelio]
MYRRLLININQVRNGFIHTQNTRLPLPSTKCKEKENFASVTWAPCTARPLGTSSISFSENKESSTSLSKDKGKTPEENEVNAEVNTDGQRNTEMNEGTEISNATLTSQLETEPVVKPEDSKQVEKTKSGKESLLELLGAMKVEVTTVRKIRPSKTQRMSERSDQEPMESTHSMFQRATAEGSQQHGTLNPALAAAASAAASTLPNRHQAESELLKQLRKHEAIPDAQRRADIGHIIADMKVGKRPNGRSNVRPTSQIRFDDDGKGYTQDRGITSELDGVRRRKSPFTSKRLNLFAAGAEQDVLSDLGPTLWDIDLANQIVQATNQMPRNGFEEMIQWTKGGKLWQYPINNEAGLEEEASVPFHEHVFLEKHLDESFPQQGPVRHFMELVITGLTKNHHLTVQEKREHIDWFRDYFKQKEDVLKEAEA